MSKTTATNRFPWQPFLINGLALWVMCAVLHDVHLVVYFAFQPGWHWPDLLIVFTLYSVLATIHACFYCIVSLLPQLVLFYILKARIRKRLGWWIIFLLPFASLGSYHLYLATPPVQARAILSNANLATLPKSAYDISVYTWSSPMSGEEFLKFTASPNDIDSFLKTSPILNGLECTTYTEKHMRIPYPNNYFFQDDEIDISHEYFHQYGGGAPDWYKSGIRGPGRRYEIQPKGYHNPGEVIIDDQTNTIFVKLVFS